MFKSVPFPASLPTLDANSPCIFCLYDGKKGIFLVTLISILGSPGGKVTKNPLVNAGDTEGAGLIPGLEKKLATHSCIVAWKIPWTEEPGRLYPWGCKESDTTEQLSMHAIYILLNIKQIIHLFICFLEIFILFQKIFLHVFFLSECLFSY